MKAIQCLFTVWLLCDLEVKLSLQPCNFNVDANNVDANKKAPVARSLSGKA